MKKSVTRLLALVAFLIPFALSAQTYQSVPYVEGFESPTGSPLLPQGWVVYQSGSSWSGTFPCAYQYSGNARNGSYYFEFESNTAATEVAATPEFDNLSSLMVDFYYAAYTPLPSFEVGVMEDTTFVPVDTIVPAFDYDYHRARVYFADYTGYGTRIAFRVSHTDEFTLLLDDLTVAVAPACISLPGTPVAVTTADEATLAWAPAANTMGYAILFDSTYYSITDTTYTFVGLNSNTVYQGFLYNICASGDTSEMVPFSFRTQCGTIALPYTEDFESVTSDEMPPCWTRVLSHSEYSIYPRSYNSLAHSGSNVLLFGYGPEVVATPVIPIPANEIEVMGWVRNDETGSQLEIGYLTNPLADSTFVPLDTIVSTSSDFESFYISFGRHSLTDTIAIAFRYQNQGYTWTFLDDLVVRQASNCHTPENLRMTANPSTEISLAWLDTISSAWQVAYGMPGFDPDTVVDNLISGIYQSDVTVTGLEDTLTYQFYVRSDCFGDYSYWAGPISARPNTHAMTANSTDTVYVCGGTITDDGGSANYTYSQTSYLVVFPEDTTMSVALSGTCSLYTVFGYDYATLTIYEGVGTNGRVLGTYTGAANVNVASTVGPLTLKFESSGYGNSYSDEGFALLASCNTRSACPDPYDFEVVGVAGASATVAWNYGGSAPLYWTLEVEDTASGNTLSFTAPDSARSFQLTGLDQTTFYRVRLQATCESGDTSNWISQTFMTTCLAGGNIAVGNGTTYSGDVINTYYSYSFCQFIINASELNAVSDSVFGIKLSAYSTVNNAVNLDIYIDTTSANTLSASNGFIPMAASARRYSNAQTHLQEGENEFRFDSVWVRPDLTKNIIITIDNNTGTWTSSTSIYGTSMAGVAIGLQDDALNVDPTNFMAYTDMSDIGMRPNVIFMTPCSDASCVAPSVTCASTSSSITLNWAPGNTETTWSVEHRLNGDTAWTVDAAATSLTTHLITGLLSNTSYDYRVTSLCDDTTAAAFGTFRTGCGSVSSFPFTEDFENFVANTDGWVSNANDTVFGPCWMRGAVQLNSYNNYPYLYTYNGHNSSKSMLMMGYYGSIGSLMVLPTMDQPLDTLILSFWGMNPYDWDTPVIEVGVMSDPTASATFVPFDTIIPTNTAWTYNEVEFIGCADSIRHIAFRTASQSDGSYFIDDITVGFNNPCRRVQNPVVSNVTGSSATISFSDPENVGSYTLYYGTVNDVNQATDSITANGTQFALNGLNGATYYYAWIRTDCPNGGSFWASVAPFRTSCSLIVVTATDSYVEDFENGFDNCADQVRLTGSGSWTIDSPYSNPSGAHGGSSAAAFDATSGDQTLLVFPAFDFSALTYGAEVNFFHAHAEWGGDQDQLHVYVRTSDTASWTLVESYLNDQPTWAESTVTLPNSDNAPYYQIAFLGVFDYGYGVYLDDVTVRTAPTCLRPTDFTVVPNDVSATLSWNGNAAAYQVEYKANGEAAVQTASTTTYSVTLSGLTPATTYQYRVRGICSATDTSLWSAWNNFLTNPCANAQRAASYTDDMDAVSTVYAPLGYDYFNHNYVQTIVDSARLAEITGDLSSMAFNSLASSSAYYNHMNVYLANVPESDLASGMIVPDSTHQFVQVLFDTSFNFNEAGWHIVDFDTTFSWDGHSNLLVAITRDHGGYNNSNHAQFQAHRTDVVKTLYINDDYSSIDIDDPEAGYVTAEELNAVPDLLFFNCDGACATPAITSQVANFESMAITWSGNGTAYEVAIKETSSANWPAETVVTTNSYTFAGLQPATSYTLRVRQDCSADSLGYSSWAMLTFTTDSMPCLAPESLAVTASTNATATFGWTVRGNETAWDIRVYNGTYDSVYTVTTNPATVGGLTAGVTYNAVIRALCGTAQNIEGEWSTDAITFSTATCPDPTDLQASDITATSVTLSWSSDPSVSTWIIEYAHLGTSQGEGTMVTVETNPFTVTGLEPETAYQFAVRAQCAPGWTSEGWSNMVTATTLEGGEGIEEVEGNFRCTVYPNPATASTTISVMGANGKVIIAVVDINGRTVASETMECSGDCEKTMNVDNLAQGAYFVRVTGENVNMVKKLIVR